MTETKQKDRESEAIPFELGIEVSHRVNKELHSKKEMVLALQRHIKEPQGTF